MSPAPRHCQHPAHLGFASNAGSLMLGQSAASPQIARRNISPCLSPPEHVPASWRGILRGSTCTMKWFQQSKLCSGLPKINPEHLYWGKQTLGVVLFLNLCCILMSESSCLQLMLHLKESRGTESRAGTVPCGAAHRVPGCLPGCSSSAPCPTLGALGGQGLPRARHLPSPV